MVSWSQARAASALFKSASSRHFEINWSIEVMEGMLKEFQDSSGKPLVLGAWFPGSRVRGSAFSKGRRAL